MKLRSWLVISSSLVGCAPSAGSAELRALEDQVVVLRGQVAEQDARLVELSNRLFVVGEALARRREDASPSTPQLPVVRLAPAEGRPPPEPPEPEADVGQVYSLDLEGPAEPGPLAVVPVAPPPRHVGRHTEADAQLRSALEAFGAGQAARAYDELLAFVQRYPDHPDLDTAWFWMGEARYEARAFGDALLSYEALRQRYPKSQKLPEAFLKIGLCHEQLGKKEQARSAFHELVQRFPTSAVAELARVRLAQGGRP